MERYWRTSRISNNVSYLRHMASWRYSRVCRPKSQCIWIYAIPARSGSKNSRSSNPKAGSRCSDAARRAIVEQAIRKTCTLRNWHLLAISVRTNHVHIVVSARHRPDMILSAFKANATRQMREQRLWNSSETPWAEKGSKRYLWNDTSLERAIDYVANGQGNELPTF